MKRSILIASVAVALGAVGLMATQQAMAQKQPPGAPPGTYQTSPQGQFAFFPASQPANSNRVGIFIARRLQGKEPEMFYCSSPVDAASQDPTACKKIDSVTKMLAQP